MKGMMDIELLLTVVDREVTAATDEEEAQASWPLRVTLSNEGNEWIGNPSLSVRES
jgi:hypothetical protein